MCINCNLLTPLSDAAAEILGVPKRKYLVIGNRTYNIVPDGKGFSNAIYNFKTMSKIKPSPDTMNKIVVNGITLYEGKLIIKEPLPLEYKPNDDEELYLELFEGELSFV